jgi:hypothetical protein
MMAVVDSVAGGDYSNFAVTFGGTEPQSGDTVRLFHGVTFDVDVSGLTFETRSPNSLIVSGLRTFTDCVIKVLTGSDTGGVINGGIRIQSGSQMLGNADIYQFASVAFTRANEVPLQINRTFRDFFFVGGLSSSVLGGIQCRDVHISTGTLFSPFADFLLRCRKISGQTGRAISQTTSGILDVSAEEIEGNNNALTWDPLIIVSATANVASRVRFRKITTGPNSQWPVQGPCYLDDEDTNTVQLAIDPGGPVKILGTPELLGDPPEESDVRDQVVYAFGNREGTLKVPTAAQTAKDVPVDDTFGEAILTEQAVRDAIGGGIGGGGAVSITITATLNGDGVPGVTFQVVGTVVSARTNTLGIAVLSVDPNETYTIRTIVPLAFEAVADQDVEVVAADVAVAVALASSIPLTPPADGMCNVSLFARKQIGGLPFEGVVIEARPITGLFAAGSSLWVTSSVTRTTGANGFALLELARGASYRLSFVAEDGNTFAVDVEVPDAESATIQQVIP